MTLNGIMKKLMSTFSDVSLSIFINQKMSEINTQKFLNMLWESTGGKKALKVCKIFNVKPLNTPKPDVPSKKAAYNLSCKDIQKI